MRRDETDRVAARASFQKLSPKEKAAHIWQYYKWYFLLGLAALIVAGSVLHRQLTKKTPVLYLSYLNVIVGSDMDAALTEDYLTAADLNPAKAEICVYRDLYLSEDASVQTHEAAYASKIKLLAAIENRQLDIVLMNREAWDILSHNGYLLELTELQDSDPSPAERLNPYLKENDVILSDNAIEVQLGEAEAYEAETKSVRNAIDLSAMSLFAEAGFGESVYMGIIANTPRREECIRYLTYLTCGTVR